MFYQVFVAGLTVSMLAATQAEARKIAHKPPASSELVGFSDCSEMRAHMAKHFKHSWNKPSRFKSGRNFGLGRAGGGSLRDLAAPAGTPAKPLSSAKRKSFANEKREAPIDGEMTGTNNQVAGVDESDFIKTDGRYFYHLSGRTLRIIKNWPATSMDLVSETQLEADARELLLADDYLVVVSESTRGNQETEITVLDVASKRRPKAHAVFRVPGQFRTARLHDNKIRAVILDYSSHISASVRDQGSQSAHQSWSVWGRSQPKPSTHDYVLNVTPAERVVGSRSEELEPIHKCRNVYLPKGYPGNNLARIVTINIDSRTFAEDLAFTPVQHVYASANSLYLASQHYTSEHGFYNATRIDSFDLKNRIHAPLQASGFVGGALLNQFAMDEHDGVLRVALTGTRNGQSNRWFSRSNGQINFVQTMQRRGDEWRTLGSTKDLAEGERIYAVRFDGDMGYVVTFRQVDPLYTIDLSRPSRPRMLGELKVPGFSTYLHMMDRDHLLAIGQDADPKTGRPLGLKLSIFDVSDRKRPREVESLLFNRSAVSEASLDHKAFTYYPAKGILAIPAAMSESNRGRRRGPQQLASLLLFKVSPKAIKPMGSIDMSDMAPRSGGFNQRVANVQVRRSFFRSDIVYAVGEAGIRAVDLDDLNNPVSTLRFDKLLTSQIGQGRRW